MVEFELEQSRNDPCVFCMVVDGKVELIMAVHADDIVIAGSDEACTDFHVVLHTKFPTNILDHVNLVNWLCFQAQLGIGHVGDHAEGFR